MFPPSGKLLKLPKSPEFTEILQFACRYLMFHPVRTPTVSLLISRIREGLLRMTSASKRLLLVIVPALLGILALAPTAASADDNSPIASTALKYLGTHGGQCWTFMQQVVYEATGRHVGSDYVQGYFDAGAVEVSADAAQNGDIIQIASDADHGPWADYPGLHTAIILKNLGGGHFDAVDSNQNWDEMVNLRPNYDPYTAADRYGLQVHIYRISGGTPVAAATFAAGDSAVVSADPGCLNLRSDAALGASILDCMPSGTAATIVDGPVTDDGYTWVKVETTRGTGWVAALYLTKTTSAPAAAPAAAPAPAGAPASDAGTTAAAVPHTAHVDNSPGCLNLRDAAGLGGAIVECLGAGTAVTLLEDATTSADGYDWAHVQLDSGTEGWVANEYLIR